jgi:hypothetical protein
MESYSDPRPVLTRIHQNFPFPKKVRYVLMLLTPRFSNCYLPLSHAVNPSLLASRALCRPLSPQYSRPRCIVHS